MPDPNTVIVTIKDGIHWQNIYPANGRLLTADDIAWTYNRMYGLGGYGFTKPGPPSATNAVKQLLDITSCVADNTANTVTFKFKGDSQESILEGVLGQYIKTVCPDVVKTYGDANDWHHAVGTGPFIVTDFVSGSSATLIANPTYWGHDERYPQNQLPYVSQLRWVIMPDTATALAGLRAGKIDALDNLDNTTASDLHKTNPELMKTPVYGYAGNDVDINNSVAPLNDVRVRQALQMAINLPELAATYYDGLVDPSPLALTSALLYPAYGWPYSQWPQELKDEYAWNITGAKALLAAAGKPDGFHVAVLEDNTADNDLLELVKGYLATINVTMDITRTDHASFLGVAFSHKVAGMAYKTPSSMGLGYSPILQVQNFQTNMLFNWEMVSDPAYDAAVADALSVTSTVDDIKKDLIIANKLTAEGHYNLSLLMPVNWGVYQPWLHNYDGQFDAISGALGVGESNYFFIARYWIDTKMKTSMGHPD
jgi:peptide/nickel transport system substrate-binding protein